MILQIALGIVLAAALLFGVFAFPAVGVPALLLCVVFWICTRPRANGQRMSSGAISAVFAVATVGLLVVLALLARPKRGASSTPETAPKAAVLAR